MRERGVEVLEHREKEIKCLVPECRVESGEKTNAESIKTVEGMEKSKTVRG